MKSIALKACIIAAAATGLGAAPAMAAPAALQPAASDTSAATPVAGLVPETGSAAVSNSLACALQTISAALQCRYT